MGDSVRLKHIYVKKLFNRFTYDIDLENGNDIAILIAPNGCGKTTILRMINFIFSPSIPTYKYISKLPFETFQCTLSNGNCIGLEKKFKRNKKRESNAERNLLSALSDVDDEYTVDEEKSLIMFINEGKKKHTLDLSSEVESIRDSLLDFTDEDMLRSYKYLRSYISEYSSKSDSTEAEIQRLSLRLKRIVKSFRGEHGSDMNLLFITADRLHSFVATSRSRNMKAHNMDYPVRSNPLEQIQDEFRDYYKKTHAEYSRKMSDAKDSLPQMYLHRDKSKIMPYEEFSREWEDYVSDIEKYYRLGLIDSAKPILDSNEMERVYSKNSEFLSVYLRAFKDTLSPWAEKYQEMKLFVDILNHRNRITHKVIKYSSNGLVVSDGDNVLNIGSLSSGEKNDLIMFYNLIFNTDKVNLVLVDEPEISLHIEWQEEYLDRLIEICKMNNFQSVVATHSPNIINGHFELYAERGLQYEG